MTELHTPYSKAVKYFGTSATEIIFDLKKLPVTKVGNLNEWSTAKLIEEVMVALHKLRLKKESE